MLKYKSYFIYLAILLIGVVFLTLSFFTQKNLDNEKNHRGPHGGRMLIDNDIAVEMTIYEHGMPPHFRAYIYKDKKPLKPDSANLVVTLKRFNNETNIIQFEPINDYLQSRQEIDEPHSFSVAVDLRLFNKISRWIYESIEGRITLSPNVIKAAGIQSAVASPTTIEQKLSVIGKITPNGDALSSIYARFGGVAKEMKKNLGDSVSKGEVIAIVESNESLRSYPITSPITGTVVQKYVIAGDMLKEDKAIYQVADLSTVWADLTLYRKEAPLVKKGMPALVEGDNGKPQATGIINYISPLGIEDSQTILARVVLPNQNQEWIPGMYVNAAITYLNKKVPVAVEASALQRLGSRDVVFVQRENTFEATPIKLGERNGNMVEVISGLKPGQSYVVKNSFLMKAELGKSEASHDH